MATFYRMICLRATAWVDKWCIGCIISQEFDLAEPEGFKDGRVTDYYRLPDEYTEDEDG